MCGRFTRHLSWQQLVELYGLTVTPLNLNPRFNIAPTTQVLAVRADGKWRFAALMRWGLIPAW